MRGCRWLLFKPSGVLRESFWGQSDAVTIAEGNIIKGDHMYVTKLSMMCVNIPNYPLKPIDITLVRRCTRCLNTGSLVQVS